MGFYIANGFGDSVNEPSADQMRHFLRKLDRTDVEHGAAWLATDERLALEWNGDGRLVFDREPQGVRHLLAVPLERVVQLWLALASGRLDDVEASPWKPGNGFVIAPERKRELEASQRASDRAFYESLGIERADTPCRSTGCARGAVTYSVLCRVHHFASVRGRPSPFDD